LYAQWNRYNHVSTWVAANFNITLPSPQTHPEFPLWKLGYSPEDVYSLFWPPGMQYVFSHPWLPSVGVFRQRLTPIQVYAMMSKDHLSVVHSDLEVHGSGGDLIMPFNYDLIIDINVDTNTPLNQKIPSTTHKTIYGHNLAPGLKYQGPKYRKFSLDDFTALPLD
jgi:hypothetical protein